MIWGPRDRHLIPGLLQRAAKGRLRRIGDGRNLIDTVYVENAAAAHLLAADALQPGSPVAGQPYFISQGEPVNCWAWIDAILALAGLPPVRRSLSLQTAWRLVPPMNPSTVVSVARPAAVDPVPGTGNVRVALFQHRPGPPRFRLRAEDFDGRRNASSGGRRLEVDAEDDYASAGVLPFHRAC